MSIQSNFGDQKYEIQVKDARSFIAASDEGLIESGVYTFVYDAGTKTLSTIYADGARTTLANPITRAQFASDDMIKFFSASTSHDIFIADDKGNVAEHLAVSPNTHVVPLNRAGADKVMVFPIVSNTGGTETDTGLDLPYKAHVYNCAVEVTTIDATETVHVGILSSETGGDADGLLVGVDVGSTGFVKPFTNTAGSAETYVSTSTFGVLMGPAVVGTNADTDVGVARGWGHVVNGSSGQSISYTPSSSDTLVGYGYVYFKQLR
jgi:hypothetical protein